MRVELDYCHPFDSTSAMCCQYLSLVWQYLSNVLSVSVNHLTVPQHCAVDTCHLFDSTSALCSQYVSLVWQYLCTVLSISVTVTEFYLRILFFQDVVIYCWVSGFCYFEGLWCLHLHYHWERERERESYSLSKTAVRTSSNMFWK